MPSPASVLAARLGRRLRQSEATVTTAESCTGGLLASAITDIAGSSGWFRRGWVCYSNESKCLDLDVGPQIIEEHGAVSSRVAIQMARGARASSGAELAIATTGIAGPGGATSGRPVGLVYIGIVSSRGEAVRRAQYGGDRSENKEAFVAFALRAAIEAWDGWLQDDPVPLPAGDDATIGPVSMPSGGPLPTPANQPSQEEDAAVPEPAEAGPAVAGPPQRGMAKDAEASPAREVGRRRLQDGEASTPVELGAQVEPAPASRAVPPSPSATSDVRPEDAALLELPDPEEIERVAADRAPDPVLEAELATTLERIPSDILPQESPLEMTTRARPARESARREGGGPAGEGA